jgi:gliding motility-associated-like protein
VTYTARDISGNSVSCSFNVIVVADQSMPVLNCPQDIIIEIFSGGSARVDWILPLLPGGCNAFDLTSSHQPMDEFRIGETTVTYTVTSQSGTSSHCSFNVTVLFKGILVHEIITPNGDGENDTWTIQNIENFADNSVIIFDRWGSIVYRGKGYGTQSSPWSGDNAPAGTYFYTLVINTGNSKIELKGFLELVK